MTRQRFVALAVAALVVLAGALWLNARRNAAPEFHQSPLLPTLAAELDTVSTLSVRKGSPTPTVTVHRTADQWTVAERGDYPADVSKVHKLLIALGDAKIVEDKTTNPAEFSLIGVDDPTQSGTSAVEVSLTARDGTHAVIIGKPAGQGSFARRAGENQSYVVQPALSLETEPRFWIDSRLVDIPLADVQSIEVKPAGEAGYLIKRTKPKEEEYRLEGVPAGRKAADSRALAPSPSLGGALSADDVALAKDVDFSKPSRAKITLAGDKVIELLGSVAGDKHWIEIQSGADAALAARLKDRAFEIPSYRYDAIFRPVEQLLVPKPSPAAKHAPDAKSGSGAKAAADATSSGGQTAPAPKKRTAAPPPGP